MSLEKIKNIKILDVEINLGCDLGNLTTMKLKTIGNLAIVKTEAALCELLKHISMQNIKYSLLGLGANQIITKNQDSLFIKLDFKELEDPLITLKSEYVLPAQITLNKLTGFAIKHSLKGWEVFTGIPATLGGAIFMNAGTTLGEIGSIIKEVNVITKEGNKKKYSMDKNSFSYRKNNFLQVGDIIISATVFHHGVDLAISELIKKYLMLRNDTQPLNAKTCGCVYKNFSKEIRAGQSIDLCGLKGLTYKGLKISHKHANFIENNKNASVEDFILLEKAINLVLQENFGVKFELEVKID